MQSHTDGQRTDADAPVKERRPKSKPESRSRANKTSLSEELLRMKGEARRGWTLKNRRTEGEEAGGCVGGKKIVKARSLGPEKKKKKNRKGKKRKEKEREK
jgi:hypothetical protein